MFFWTDQNETPLSEAVILDDAIKVREIANHPDHRKAVNHLGFNGVELAYYLDRQELLKMLDPDFKKEFKVQPPHSDEVIRMDIRAFEDFFKVHYVSHVKFYVYRDFYKTIRSCPSSIKNGTGGEGMCALYQKHKDKLEAGYVVDSTIRWVDETMGYGLFANQSMEKGDLIGEYCGQMQLKSLMFRDYGEYCFRYPVFSYGLTYYTLNGEKTGNELRFANHSYTPNMQPTASLDHGLNHTLFIAKRKIAQGEQLTYDYGEDYWSKREPPQDI